MAGKTARKKRKHPDRKREEPRVLENRLRALKLRKAGGTYEQIAELLGVGTTQAFRYVQHELDKLRDECPEVAADVRDLELQRLDDMLHGIWEAAIKGNTQAIQKVLSIMERRARFLGLDAPEKRALTTPEGEAIEYDELTDRQLTLIIRRGEAEAKRKGRRGGVAEAQAKKKARGPAAPSG